MDTSLLSSPTLWAGVFVGLMVVELSTSGAFAGFLGLGALVTSFYVHFFEGAETQSIVLVFLGATCVCAAVLWKPLKRRYAGRDTTDAEEGIEPFINDFGTVEGAVLTPRGGHIMLHGARMRAVLDEGALTDTIEVGERVRVIRQDQDQRFVVVPAD